MLTYTWCYLLIFGLDFVSAGITAELHFELSEDSELSLESVNGELLK